MLLQCIHKDHNADHSVTIAVMCYITIKFSQETGDALIHIGSTMGGALTTLTASPFHTCLKSVDTTFIDKCIPPFVTDAVFYCL